MRLFIPRFYIYMNFITHNCILSHNSEKKKSKNWVMKSEFAKYKLTIARKIYFYLKINFLFFILWWKLAFMP